MTPSEKESLNTILNLNQEKLKKLSQDTKDKGINLPLHTDFMPEKGELK